LRILEKRLKEKESDERIGERCSLNGVNMNEVKERIEKRQPKRRKEDCCSQIYQLLALASKPLTTSDIAEEVNLSHKSTLSHLKYLEFDDKVKHFERGSWLYWKIKR